MIIIDIQLFILVENLLKTHIENHLYMKCNCLIFVLSISLQTRLNSIN